MLRLSRDEEVSIFVDSEFCHERDPVVVELCTAVHESAAVVAIVVVLLHSCQECTEILEKYADKCAVEAFLLAHNLLMNKIERFQL